MKLFKRIYYPVMGVLLAAALVMGFVDAYVSGTGHTDAALAAAARTHVETIAGYSRDAYNPTGKTQASNYIYNTLTGGGFLTATPTTADDGITSVSYRTENGAYVPTVTRVTSAASDDTLTVMDGDKYVDSDMTNVIAVVPGTDTLSGTAGQAVLVAASYEAVLGSESASAAVPVGVLLELALDAAANGNYRNDIVFLFYDGGTQDDLGLYVFAEQFAGFDGIAGRIGLVGHFAPLGDGSEFTLYAGGNAAVLGDYSSVNGSHFLSSAINKLLGIEAAGGAFDVPAVSAGQFGVANPPADTFADLPASAVEKQTGLLTRFLDTYGSADLDTYADSDGGVFFSYLNGTVAYPKYVSYILGGVILALAAAVVIVNAKKKSFSFGRSFAGLFVQIVSLLATVVTLFIAYYVVALLCAGFGAFNIHAINTLLYSNAGLLIGAMLLCFAMSAAFNTVLKKTFFIKAPDSVRGNVWLWALLGAVLSFAVPEVAYLVAFGAILELVVMLVVTAVKDKYRAKFSSDIERLFLYAVPLIVVLPAAVSFIAAASGVFRLLLLPIVLLPFILMCGFVTPYASYLVPVLDRAAKKLPQRKIRVERTFEEEKVDPAKPGKKGEIVKVRKVVTEKVDWNYRNWMGVTAVTVLSCVVLVLSCVFGRSVNAAAGSRFAGDEAIYDNAVVYLWSKTDSGVSTQVVIKDTDAYRYMSDALTDFSWDADRGAYVKTVYNSDIVTAEPTIAFDSGTYTVTPFDGERSSVVLTVRGASAVTKLTIAPTSGTEREPFDVTNDGEDTIVVRLPYGYGAFTMTTEGTTDQLEIGYVEYRPGEDSNIRNLSEWQDVTMHFADDDEVLPYLNAAIVLEYDF